MDADVRWVATLSDGNTVVEKQGQFENIPGERVPWVRLCAFLENENLYLTSLRLNFNGRTIHLPRMKFDKFNQTETNVPPSHYSLQYWMEAHDLLGANPKNIEYVDLAAHFDEGLTVHFVQDITDGNNSWIYMSKDSPRLAQTPPKNSSNTSD